MNNFFFNNWDKILYLVISIGFGGLTGYFSASIENERNMSFVKERLKKAESELSNINTKIQQISINENKINKVNEKMAYIEGKFSTFNQSNSEVRDIIKETKKELFSLQLTLINANIPEKK